jgi:hypothetical protein
MPRGNFGEIRAFNDFTGTYETVTWDAATNELGGGWGLYSVNEGTIQDVKDEEGGVIQLLTDTGDNDNAALVAGPFKPSNGGCVIEARFKVADDLNVAFFAGFMETLVVATPVMAAEYATATMTINGSGGVADDKDLTQFESITGAITASDLFYAVLMIENREAAAKEFEVDYVYARGFRDWTA